MVDIIIIPETLVFWYCGFNNRVKSVKPMLTGSA